jgi:enediyne biosynthesis protein E4
MPRPPRTPVATGPARGGASRWVWVAAGVLLLAGAALGLALVGRRRPREGDEHLPRVSFRDVTKKWGINFTHHTGAFGQKLLPETMGSGVAVIDFDNDGRPDLLFVDSRPWPGYEKGGEPLPTLRFFRNLGKGKFTDVTKEVGLGVSLYGMGVAVGDFDNDGFPDLFVTAVGGNRLFRNVKAPEGQGANGRMFRDVTASARVGGPGGWPDLSRPGDFLRWKAPLCWSTSAAFLDYDGDGLLDLFVCNYLTWSPADDVRQKFRLSGGHRAYGPPRAFPGTNCFLYRNLGGGKFEDVSAKAGVQVFQAGGPETGREGVAKALGVIVCDVDGDGWPDVVVANDTSRNFFFHNIADPRAPGGRRFEEVGQEAGVAYAEGNARGAMGIDWAPAYRPGKGALLIGNFADEPDSLLVVGGPRRLHFTDSALAEGVAGPSRAPLKFGVLFFDYDLDGRPDLLTCNGHLEPDIAHAEPGQQYAQPAQLFWNAGPRGGFEVVPPKVAGPDLFAPLVGRGCAYADLDGDGKLDVILTANGGPARVLRNEGGAGNHWLRLKLVGDGERSNASAIGARVTLEAGGVVQEGEVASARGYLSQSELVLTFGLGESTRVDRVTVRWPGKHAGPPQVVTGLAVDREHRIVQGAAP